MSEKIKEHITLCLGTLHGGNRALALEHGRMALHAAEDESSPALIAEAAWAYGCALTWAGQGQDALQRLRRALGMAERAGPEGRHLLERIRVATGAAFLALGDVHEARRHYRAALAEPGATQREKTLIELARLEEDGGDVAAGHALLAEARALARARLALALPADERAEANLDLATAASNAGRSRIVVGDLDAADKDLQEATDAAARIVADGYRVGPLLLGAIEGLWKVLAEKADDPELQARADAARARLQS